MEVETKDSNLKDDEKKEDIENKENKDIKENKENEENKENKTENEKKELEIKGNKLNFRMVWNKTNYDISKLGTLNSVGDLRKQIETLTGIPTNMQKIMYKGLVKDDNLTLEDIKITNNAKVMVVGSTPKDLDSVKTPSAEELKEERKAEAAASKEALCKQKIHKKVLEKGKPDDVLPGIKNVKESLPAVPLSGMSNKYGGKVRLTFKLEADQLWLGTKERTEKLPMSSIRNVISEPIEDQEEYHIMALQLGTTEASRYWIYWVPAQYVDAIKDVILGKWQAF